MVTHKEALNKACDAYEIKENDDVLDAMQDAIRAYLDARGLVMVPKDANAEMMNAGLVGIKNNWRPLYSEGWAIDEARLVQIVLSRALAAAPDPFGDAE